MLGRLSFTFDDAMESVFSLALPELERHHMTATVFAISDMIGSQYLGYPVMTGSMLSDLFSRGWEVGSHTKSHPKLTTLSSERVSEELEVSKRYLMSLIGGEVTSLAYPYGQFDGRIMRLASRYYASARTLSCYPPLRSNPTVPRDTMRLRAMSSYEPTFTLPLHLYATYAPAFVRDVFHARAFQGRHDSDGKSAITRMVLNARIVAKWIRGMGKARWLILCFHNITMTASSTPYNVGLEEFRKIIELAASGPEIVTIRDVVREQEDYSD